MRAALRRAWAVVAAAIPASASAASDPATVAGLAALGLAALLALGLSLRVWSRAGTARALAGLQARLDRIVGPSEQGTDPIDRLEKGLDEAERLLEYERSRSAEEGLRRARAEEGWRESEQRYALAIRGANDGLWEWDLRTGSVYYSPRWKNLLGYPEDQVSADAAEWTARIHPDDRARTLADLECHLAGGSERFESEHRLQHRDSTWRWVSARACAVRHANGKPIRLVGLMTDISARKRTQELLLELAEGFSQVRGEDCLRRLVRAFSQALGVSEAFVCECCDTPPTRVRMLARWKRGDYARCVEFDLEGTACEDVIRTGATLFHPSRLGERWPLERQFERESYLGLPCLDSEGRVIGHVACADPEPMPDELPHQALLKLFAVRASMELERRRLERERGALGMRNFGPAMRLH